MRKKYADLHQRQKRPRVRLDDADGDPQAGRRAAAKSWRGIKAHNLRLSEELIADFAALLENGLPFNEACALLEVSVSAARAWMRSGREYLEAKPEDRLAENLIYAALRLQVEKARAAFLFSCIRNALTKQDWRRWISILSRRDRQHWAAVTHDPAAGYEAIEHEAPADVKYV